MVKKIYFQSIFFSFFFIKEAFAAESGGMPQLNPEFWFSQIFWLVLTFSILFVVLSKLILPKISENLESRKSKILENIQLAEKQREESENKIPKVIMSQNIWENQNSGSSWGIPPLSAACIKFIKKKYTIRVLNNIFLNIN